MTEQQMTIDVNDLALFAKVIDYGSFTAAAEHTGLPKSTLSRRITSLEQQLGERLMVRNTRRLAITEFGQAVLEHAHSIAREALAVGDLANYRQITPSGNLKVSMPPNYTDFIKKDFFQKFINDYPQISLNLDFSSRRVDIMAERYDLAIRMASKLADDATLVARPLKDLSGGLYASPAYLKKHGMPKTPVDIENHTGILLTNSMGEVQNWQLKAGKESWQGLPKGVVTSNSIETIRLLATQGLGIIAITTVMVHDCVQQGQLVRILEDWQMPSTTMWAITSGRKLLPMKIQVFLKELKQALL